VKARRTGRERIEVVIPGKESEQFSVWVCNTYVDVVRHGRRAAAVKSKLAIVPTREANLR
jgi:hypothetical protein